MGLHGLYHFLGSQVALGSCASVSPSIERITILMSSIPCSSDAYMKGWCREHTCHSKDTCGSDHLVLTCTHAAVTACLLLQHQPRRSSEASLTTGLTLPPQATTNLHRRDETVVSALAGGSMIRACSGQLIDDLSFIDISISLTLSLFSKNQLLKRERKLQNCIFQ